MLRKALLVCGALLWALGSFPADGQVPSASPPTLGAPAPELKLEKLLQAPAGTKTDWASLRGHVVVLEFWATWCAPCIAAMPHLNELAEKFKDRQLQVIAITDESESFVAPFIRRRVIKGWVGLNEDRSVFDAYGVRGIPRTIVVDREGKIAALTIASRLTEAKLTEILEGKSANVIAEKIPVSTPAASNPPGPEDTPSRFEITIKPTKSVDDYVSQGRGKFHAEGVNLTTALSLINDFDKTRIIGPPLLEESRYNISARMLEGNTDDLKTILASIIQASFKLRVRREQNEMEVFVLAVPKEATVALKPNPATTGHSSEADGVITAAAMPIGRLVAQLEGVLKQPVIDETKLSDKYNWTVLFDQHSPDSICDAILQELGLDLKRSRRQVEVMLVEAK